MVKQHIENAIKQIQAEKERAIVQAKERVTREKVVPHNAEVNQSRDNAISALTQKLNEDIAKLQEAFANERQSLIDIGEKNKAEFANSVIEAEVALVTVNCDQAIADLQKLVEKSKE